MNRAQPLKGKASSNIVNKHTIVYQNGSQGKAWEQLCTIHCLNISQNSNHIYPKRNLILPPIILPQIFPDPYQICPKISIKSADIPKKWKRRYSLWISPIGYCFTQKRARPAERPLALPGPFTGWNSTFDRNFWKILIAPYEQLGANRNDL